MNLTVGSHKAVKVVCACVIFTSVASFVTSTPCNLSTFISSKKQLEDFDLLRLRSILTLSKPSLDNSETFDPKDI